MKKQSVKRAVAFCLSILLLLFVFVLILSEYYRVPIRNNATELVYYNSDNRNSSKTAMKTLFEGNAMPVFGSSELSSAFGKGYPKFLYNDGNSDFNMVLIGRGTMQCLHHSINVAALSDSIPSKKVVLILSPQWFTKTHLSSDAYSSRFSERMFVNAISNNKLSYNTKRKLADRAESYLQEGDPTEYRRVLMYDRVYIEKNIDPAAWLYLKTWDLVQNIRADKNALPSSLSGNYDPSTKVHVESIDFAALLTETEEEGELSCTNNSLYIEDSYFTTYIEKDYEANRGYQSSASYLDSPEYEDFELFLTVCKETGIEPLVISIPLTGFWSDYTGFPFAERSAYYQKIRDICREHDVSIMDFSDREYEPYFLKDIMHLGWKGWVYLDEAVYRFSLDNDVVIDYPFAVNGIIYFEQNKRVLVLDTHLSDVKDAELRINGIIIPLQENDSGFLEADITKHDNSLFDSTCVAELYVSGKRGAGITANIGFVNPKELTMGDGSMSPGTSKTDRDGYIFTTEVEGNSFSYMVFQLRDQDGSYIMNIGQSSGIGKNSGTYFHNMKSGDYKLVFIANSNKADEYVSWNVHLEEDQQYSFEYTIDKMKNQYVETSYIRFWSTK